MFVPAFVEWNAAGTLSFYREDLGGILVSRIFHQRMLPERHAIDDRDAGP
jgi:hypothetical protein